MDKKKLNETDIISKFIMPAVQSAQFIRSCRCSRLTTAWRGLSRRVNLGIVKSSNGLLSMTAMMAAILTGNKIIAKDVSQIQRRHEDCLPILLRN